MNKAQLKIILDIKNKVSEIKEARSELIKLENNHERQKIFKIKELLRKTGNNSREYWNLIKGNHDHQSTHSLLKDDGTYTQTPQETMERAETYFQNLFAQKVNWKLEAKIV